MTSMKDWVLSQVVSKSMEGTRPLSASECIRPQEPSTEELENLGVSQSSSDFTSQSVSNGSSSPSNDIQRSRDSASPQVEGLSPPRISSKQQKLDPLAKVEALQINFFRLVGRLGQSPNNLLVAKVLYRIHLSALIRAGESDLERAASLNTDRARVVAAEQEEASVHALEFSLRILVLGKTGVGKSSTINSVLGESKVTTDAFRPATDRVQEIVGTVNGIKISFIDTPGLLPPSASSIHKNRKTLHSVKRFIRKSRPDVVLYFDRLDSISMDFYDFPLLKLITDILGPAIWFSTNIVLTHSSSVLPEGHNGYPVNLDSYARFCAQLLQRDIQLATSDTKFENPVVLVENHPFCKANHMGKQIFPNGKVWTSQFLLLCVCTKILNDVNRLMQFEDSIQLGPVGSDRVLSLPHLLSSFLEQQIKLSPGGAGDDADEIASSDTEEEDAYDQLPPIRILTKAQFQKLNTSQKRDYLDELDYRETLYLKKQLKLENNRRQKRDDTEVVLGDNPENREGPSDAIMLPDMEIPPSFDSDSSVHMFRRIATSDSWLAGPALDPHGWDHDVGFDSVNLEATSKIGKHVIASVAGQLRKDKQDFRVQSESTVSLFNPRGPIYSVGLDMQSAGNELMCSIRGNTELKNMNIKRNVAECGVSLTSFGNKFYYCAKIKDSIFPSRRLKLKMNAGAVMGAETTAYGGRFDALFKGRDFPVRDEKVVVSTSFVTFEKETVLGAAIDSDFRVSRSTKMSVSASMDSRRMGQICLKINSCEHIEIALVAVASLLRGLLRKKSSYE